MTEDFKNLRGRCGGGSAAAGVGAPELGPHLAEVKVSANMDTVDGASSVTLKKKTVDIEKLRRSFTDKYVSLCLCVRNATGKVSCLKIPLLSLFYRCIYFYLLKAWK